MEEACSVTEIGCQGRTPNICFLAVILENMILSTMAIRFILLIYCCPSLFLLHTLLDKAVLVEVRAPLGGMLQVKCVSQRCADLDNARITSIVAQGINRISLAMCQFLEPE